MIVDDVVGGLMYPRRCTKLLLSFVYDGVAYSNAPETAFTAPLMRFSGSHRRAVGGLVRIARTSKNQFA